MSSERPSDALQPSSKRRAAGQATKDDVEDDDDEVQDPGSWKPVDGGEIAKRRKVKVRRAGGSEPEPAAEAKPAGGNPFAGIALTPPPASANPFSGINLLAPAGQNAESKSESQPAADAAATPAADKDKSATAAEPSVDAEPAAGDAKDSALKDAAPGSSTPGFGSFAAGSNPFAALTSSSKSGGFGGFGGFAPAQASKPGETPTTTPAPFTPLFGTAGKPSGFTFGTSTFPAIGATPKTGAADDGEEGGDDGNVELFNDSTAEFKPVVQLPDQKRVTGEEEESVTFSADSTLFEFEASSSKWRERGKGEFRLNLDKAGQARMVMRQSGNYRLLLNAKVYSGMAVQKMSSDVGVTFACANAASSVDGAGQASQEKKEGEAAAAGSTTPGADATPKLATWCLKIKSKELVTRLHDLLSQHKSSAPPSV